jgi:hypothetical protein
MSDTVTFPTLRTGAVAQYPLERTTRYATEGVRFLDGSEQKFRILGNPLHRWAIQLDLLDEQELGAVIAFVDQQEGASFAFTDPVTGSVFARCAISGEQFDAAMTGEMKGRASLVIEEIL